MSEIDENSRIKDRIWITAKSRIYAEKRLRKYDIISHLILVLLSVIVIALTLLKGTLPQQAPLDTYTVVYSVFILAASIVVFGFRYGETATLHRECYLRLQQLHDSREPAEEIERRYHEILSSYPNHSDHDYECLVLGRTFLSAGGMSRPDGTPIKWTWGMACRWIVHEITFWGVPFVLFASSVGTIFWAW